MTTLSSPQLNKRIRELRRQGVEWLVLETTSHAVAQSRVWGVPYQIAVMTNITHEHLDYHGTFEAYRDAKKQLFTIASRHKVGFGVINADDEQAAIFASTISTSRSYGVKHGDVRAENITLTSDKSVYDLVQSDGTRTQMTCYIPGEFNVYNSMAAALVGERVGLTNEQIRDGLATLKGVDGRMMTIDEGQNFSVVIDFAHTPDSFERLLHDLRAATKGKLVVLFGSAGRRDEAKRAIQGEIAGKYADEVILTEEDDRDIDGHEILEQIASGVELSGKRPDEQYFKVLDRSEAIRFAMTRVGDADDTVVLLGKGHEKTIERADGEHPWNEEAEARQSIKQVLG